MGFLLPAGLGLAGGPAGNGVGTNVAAGGDGPDGDGAAGAGEQGDLHAAAWALLRELWFGVQTERLVHILEAENGLPVDDLPHRASGRPLREAADAEFPRYKAEVEADPGSWRAWFRLGLAYDASGDRRRARQAMREAIKLRAGGTASLG